VIAWDEMKNNPSNTNAVRNTNFIISMFSAQHIHTADIVTVIQNNTPIFST